MRYRIAGLGWNNGGDSLVETQDFASHEEVSARRGSDNVLMLGCVYCLGDARFCVSTLGRMRYHIAGLGWNNGGASLVETQNLASHGEVSICLSVYYSVWILGWAGRETQDFASLLLGTSDMAMGKIYLACGGAEGAAYMYRKTKNGERKHYFGRVLTFTVFFSNFVC